MKPAAAIKHWSNVGESLKAKGYFVRACSPSLVSNESGAPVWTLPVFSLSMLLELHYLEVTSEQVQEIPVVELGSLYRTAQEEAVFIATGTKRVPGEVDGGEYPEVQAPATVVDVSCPLCCFKVSAKMLHNHMGAHILLERLVEAWEREAKYALWPMRCARGDHVQLAHRS